MGKIFKEYYSRLAKEGLLKALLCGLIVGFSVLLVSAAVCWYVGYKQVWVCALIMAAAAAATTPIFYYAKFRPSTKDIARRIDELGLEERMLTMAQLEGDDSYIAMKQREDAVNALNMVNAKLVKIAVSVPLVVAAAVLAVGGAGMTTVAAVSKQSGESFLEEKLTPPLPQYEVVYEVEGSGLIEGMDFQLVEEGSDAASVMAVADPEWAFVEWSDGSTDPIRTDLDITKDMTVVAIFMEAEPGEGEGEGEPGEEGDQASDAPAEGESQGNSEDGEPSSSPSEGDGAGGRYEESNQVNNGETYYGDEYAGEYEDALGDMAGDGSASDGDKGSVGKYYDTIAQN